MSRILEYKTFIAIYKFNSISKAAKYLNTSPSSVSKRLLQLEQSLSIQLVERSTHHLSITPLGKQFYTHCVNILDEITKGESAIKENNEILAGKIKISLPDFLSSPPFMNALDPFFKQHANIKWEFSVTNDINDLINADIDFCFRTGEMSDSRLIAHFICTVHHIFCASPCYLQHTSLPESYCTLIENGELIMPNFINLVKMARLLFPNMTIDFQRIAHYTEANKFETIIQLTKLGNGVALVPQLMVQESLDNGELIHIYPEYQSIGIPLNLVFRKKLRMTKIMDYFKQYVKEELSQRLTLQSSSSAAMTN